MRTLFGRGETGSISTEQEVISIANNLENHVDGRSTSLREASREFVDQVDGDGFAHGCRESGLMKTIPSWVGADEPETRTLEGVLEKSKMTYTDFPLSPWHDYYDWNFDIELDPQYGYLLSEWYDEDGHLHCEWDTEHFPRWAWPQEGDRVKLIGRWIYDCGHPEDGKHKSELHPVKAMVAIRPDAVPIDHGDRHQRVNEAFVYIGQEGGYWTHDINDQDYAFDLPLPPKPYDEAEPTWRVEAKTDLPVEPEIEPFPPDDPASLRVEIPLEGVTPHPDEYGVVIMGGWTDPRATESEKIHRVRVTVEKLELQSNEDYGSDDWHFYAGVNGRWDVWQGFGGWEKDLGLSVLVDVHSDDEMRISACGFEADLMHNHMGEQLTAGGDAVTWGQIRTANDSEARGIRNAILAQLADTFDNRNEKIDYETKTIDPSFRGHGTIDTGDYTLHYRVEEQ